MEKSFSPIKALLCAALLLVIFISLFLPVATFNSAEKFESDTKLGYYNVDLQHAGKVKYSLVSYLFSTGDEVNTLVELYKLEADYDEETDLTKKAAIKADIDELMAGISDSEDEAIQIKLADKSFLKKVALRAAMYDAKKGSSRIALPLVISIIAFALILLDITLKVIKYIKEKRQLNDGVVKALSDFRLPIIAFILQMFTTAFYVNATRGTVSLGAGIIVGLIAAVLFAVVRCLDHVLEAQAVGGDKYKKTVIKQSIALGVLIITVIVSLLGVKMSGLMINDINDPVHCKNFEDVYIEEVASGNNSKYTKAEAVDNMNDSMSIMSIILSGIPLISYAALGYMLARVGVVEKTRIRKKRTPKTPLGSFYIGFIFIAVAYILSLVLFTVDDSAKRSDMYKNCQMSVVFTEYEEEGTHDYVKYNALSEYKTDVLDELLDMHNENYKNASDEQAKSEIEIDIENTQLEIEAVEKQMDRIESRKKSNIIAIIVLATIAIAAEIVFKMVKFEAEKIADSGKENN